MEPLILCAGYQAQYGGGALSYFSICSNIGNCNCLPLAPLFLGMLVKRLDMLGNMPSAQWGIMTCLDKISMFSSSIGRVSITYFALSWSYLWYLPFEMSKKGLHSQEWKILLLFRDSPHKLVTESVKKESSKYPKLLCF